MSTATDPILDVIDARFDHVAHAAPHIRELMPIYQDLLGGSQPFGGANQAVGYRALQLTLRGGARVELIDPIEGSAFLTGFLAERPRGGVHHLTFKVADLAIALQRGHALGIGTFGERFDLEWQREAFIHPRQGNGALIQLIEPRQPRPKPMDEAELTEFLAN